MAEHIKIITISDLHLNLPKVSTTLMVNRLISTLMGIKDKLTYHYLIIPGDIFDRPTQMDTEAGKEISRFISFTLDYVNEFKLKLLVLKGTGSHDGDQPAHFKSINQGRLKPVSLRYIDKIDVWRDEDFNLTFLGVPDESAPSTTQVQAQVESLLKEKGIDKVDIALTHGMYTHHCLNGMTFDHSHESDYYDGITKYILLNGHIHTSSLHKKLLTIGSFDRNRHGEEEAKGGWLVDIELKTGLVKKTFLPNKDASLFITREVVEDNVSDAYLSICKYLDTSKLMTGGFLRLAYSSKELDINELVKQLQTKYRPNVEITTKKLDAKETLEETSSLVERQELNITPITPNTVNDLLIDKLNRMGIEETDKYLDRFKVLIGDS